MPSERILVPIDFSDCSRLLVAEAARLAGRLGAELTLLHVMQTPEGLSDDSVVQIESGGPRDTVARTQAEAARGRLPEYVRVAQQAGVGVRVELDQGDAARCILAHQSGHAFVIMGTHGRRGMARMLLGSVAEQVTRHARVPVMTVRTEHRPDCQARSCEWCSAHVTAEDLRLRAERDG